MKEDPSIRSVLASRVIYGGVVEPEANAFVSTSTEGVPKPNLEARNKVANAITSGSERPRYRRVR